MLQATGRTRVFTLSVAIMAATAGRVAIAQQGPVAAMFDSDQKRDASRATSFQFVDLPAAKAAQFPVRVYLSAGDLERAFDRAEFRPDAAIVPTNTDLLIATDFAKGEAIDLRELYAQDRVRKGVAACLEALDGAGARSVVLPLMGAASSETQTNDAMFEGQRVLMECRLINSTAGIALGIHDFAASRRSLREIGIVQWDRELDVMFKVPSGSRAAASAQAAYGSYAEQVKEAFRRGLAGEKTTASDVKGSCNAILNAQ